MVENYSVKISSNTNVIVSTENYQIFHNDIAFLFGESGIGKSMLSKAIYGLLDKNDFNVTINNKPYEIYLQDEYVKQILKNGFFVFQEPSSHLNPLIKISQQLKEGSLRYFSKEENILSQLWSNSDINKVAKILDVYPKPYRPSGGEKQRVLLAMAFKKIEIFLNNSNQNQKAIFVFDEPTGSLDNNYRNIFLKMLFEKYSKKHFTIIIITHDYSIISEIYQNYKNLIPNIHFLELRRKNSNHEVEIVNFYAQEYLKWLEEKAQKKETGSFSENQVLKFDSRFKIFGRNLAIFKDSSHTKETDLVINKGEMVYVKAPSGVGKTTLAKVIMGLYLAQKFNMSLCGINFTQNTPLKIWAKKIWGKKATMVFQHADESLNLLSNVKEVFKGLPISQDVKNKSLLEILFELFDEKINEEFLNKKVGMLSGGQKQRLNLLRSLVLNTDLLILDEPLNGLDFLSVKKVISILEKRQKQGTGLLMISHNEEIFDNFIDEKHIYYLAEI
jgi:ABC-type glutathione transport system ATPase component